MNILRTIKCRKTEVIILLVFIFEFVFPHYSIAAELDSSLIIPELTIKSAESDLNQKVSLPTLIRKDGPQIEEENNVPVAEVKVVKTYSIPITAYSSTVDQTDATPCITANGFDLCEHNQEDVLAANFLPFGTKVRIPEYFGDRIFTVQDRMNTRYYYQADIWLKTREAAKKFGIVRTTIEVLE